jgi:hypothetical protein
MNGQLQMYKQTTLEDLLSVTFSVDLAAGVTPSDFQGGQMTGPCGQLPCPASRSVSQETKKEKRMKGTCCPTSLNSLDSASLTESLANKLKEQLSTVGSMIYTQQWKQKTTPLGLQYWAHTASTPRTKGNAYIGLHKAGYPTPKTGMGGANHNAPQVLAGNHGMNLEGMAHVMELAGLPTPSTRDHKGGYQGGRIRNGKLSTDTLDVVAQTMTGWATPNCMDLLPARSKEAMERQFSVARNGRTAPANLREQVHPELYPQTGVMSSGSTAAITNIDQSSQDLNQFSGQLNPALSRWLMGYPQEWCIAAIQASRLMPTKRKKHE